MNELQKAVIKTLAYADIFDYPLTLSEAWRFLIDSTRVTAEVVQKALLLIIADCKLIDADKGFYFLKGREEIVKLRKEREEWSKKKWTIAQKTADKLKMIPTIKMVGVTGALAMDNCEQDDDIDLIIITSGNCLWLTRLLILLASPLLGIKRRKPKDISVKDKICFNLFLEENHLRVEPKSLFLAHEIVQVKPIFDNRGVHERFLKENQWTRKYLPNAVISSNSAIQQFSNCSFIVKLLNCFIVVFDKIAFYLQYQYMRPKITNEKINRYQAFFHPKDLQNKIEKEYKKRLKQLGIIKWKL